MADANGASPTGSFTGLALWLAPPSSARSSRNLKSLITSLAEKHSTPTFSPHVTLLTGFARAETADLLAALNRAIDSYRESYADGSLSLEFDKVGTHHPNYFQYLFAVVRPSPQLLALRAEVRKALSPDLDPSSDDYFPHLSLVYGVDEGARKVSEMISELSAGQSEGDQFEVSGERGVDVHSVQLLDCTGPPEDWRVIGQVDL